MRFALPSRLVMIVTAATIAMTSLTAVPVYADNDRGANAAAAILGLAVIGAIIADDDDHKHKKVHRHVPQRKVYKHRNSAQKRLIKQRQRIAEQRQRQRLAEQRHRNNRGQHNGGQRQGGRN